MNLDIYLQLNSHSPNKCAYYVVHNSNLFSFFILIILVFYIMRQDRRRIESDFFSGRICGIAATNALELGIDVGHIDVTLHLGFPGSIARYGHVYLLFLLL